MRVGIYGGSFDPIHYGHLILAETCRESAGLEQIWFIPAAVSPHKTERDVSTTHHRLEMLRLAIDGHPAFVIQTLELERGGISYTADTLRQLRDKSPTVEMFLLMGADSLHDFPRWREPQTICQFATPLVVQRAHAAPPDLSPIAAWLAPKYANSLEQLIVEMPLIELSSTELRARAQKGRSLRYRTPRAVEKYIESHGLYR